MGNHSPCNRRHHHQAAWWARLTMVAGSGLLLGAALLPAGAGAAVMDPPITGTVFVDINGDGLATAPGHVEDPAAAGVVVTAFDEAGAAASTTTGADGTYSLDVTPLGEGPFRLEFSGYADLGWESAPYGAATASSVRRGVDAGSVQHFGVLDPSRYCASNARLVISCFANGDGNRTTGTSKDARALLAFRHDDSGYPGSPGYVAPTVLNRQRDVGSVHGIATSRATGKVYAAAYLKRHTGLGPAGAGAIYEVDPVSGAVTRTFQVADPGTVPARDLPDRVDQPSEDLGVYPLIGRMGLGDVDASPDGDRLFVINLHTRSLVRLTGISGTPTQAAFAVPDVGCPGGSGNQRPFGLGVRAEATGTAVYVGVTCTAEGPGGTDDDLAVRIVRFDDAGSAFTGTVLSIPLTAANGGGRGCVWRNPPALGCAWHRWTEDYASFQKSADGGLVVWPMPFVADIDFDATGAMVVGLGDRLGSMLGYANYAPNGSKAFVSGMSSGDQLRACPAGATWTLEANGACGGVTTSGAGNGEGPGGGEFYLGDGASGGGAHHADRAMGALATVPGRTGMVATGITPNISAAANNESPRLNSSGVAHLNHDTGAWDRPYDLNSNPRAGGEGIGTFAKASGLGDLEVLCEAAPIEIGNLVWFDTDKDGIQDPDEPPIAGVRVELRAADGTVLAVAVTDEQGRYWFMSEGAPNALAGGWDSSSTSGDPNPLDAVGIVTDPNGNPGDGVWGIKEGTAYTIRFDVSTAVISPELTALGVATAADLQPTVADADPSAGGDTRDSDIIDVDPAPGVQPGIRIVTGGPGANDHTFDAGFVVSQAPPPTTTTTTTSTTSTTVPETTTTTSTTVPDTTTTSLVPNPTTTAAVPTSVLPATTERVPEPTPTTAWSPARPSVLAVTGAELPFALAAFGFLLLTVGGAVLLRVRPTE